MILFEMSVYQIFQFGWSQESFAALWRHARNKSIGRTHLFVVPIRSKTALVQVLSNDDASALCNGQTSWRCLTCPKTILDQNNGRRISTLSMNFMRHNNRQQYMHCVQTLRYSKSTSSFIFKRIVKKVT